MALITTFEEVSGQPRGPHAPTRAQYQVFRGSDGAAYFQLDTLGTEGREMKDTPSQKIQLDRKGMAQLIEILARALQKA